MFALGDVIRRLRKDRGWTLDDLREASGVNKTTLSQIESGRIDPRASTLEKIASALGMQNSAGALQLVTRSDAVPNPSPLNYPVHPASTNRENSVPKGDREDDPATTRLRELEARIERQDLQIQELRDMLKRVTRVAIKRAESGAARKNQTRRGRSDK